jgi:hypothetical protein
MTHTDLLTRLTEAPQQRHGTAGTRFFGSLIKAGEDIAQGKNTEHTWKDLNTVGGILFHYPASQLNRVAAGFEAWQNGEAPPTAILFGPPPKN